MDIFTHALSGALLAASLSLSISPKKSSLPKALFFGVLGGVAPDVDALSRAPGFDMLGSLLNLQTGAEIYGGSLWYSHHHASHSLLAAALVALALWKIARLKKISALAFFAGWCCHLLGDLPTPGSVWSGIQLFWPHPVMIGGWGNIWWWNNYDITLLIALGCVLVGIIGALKHKIPAWLTRACSITCLLLISAVCSWQILHRKTSYAYEGNTPIYHKLEEASLKYQRAILGEDLYEGMSWIDSKIPIPF